MTRIIAMALLVTGTLVLSCQGATPGPPSDDQGNAKPSVSPSPESTPTTGAGLPAQPTVGLGQEETRAADLARRQLVSDKGISTDQIQVIGVEKVDWSDTSLGCPEPGQMYAQVITPGYRVVLSAQGVTYEYHTAGTERAVLCKR